MNNSNAIDEYLIKILVEKIKQEYGRREQAVTAWRLQRAGHAGEVFAERRGLLRLARQAALPVPGFVTIGDLLGFIFSWHELTMRRDDVNCNSTQT